MPESFADGSCSECKKEAGGYRVIQVIKNGHLLRGLDYDPRSSNTLCRKCATAKIHAAAEVRS